MGNLHNQVGMGPNETLILRWLRGEPVQKDVEKLFAENPRMCVMTHLVRNKELCYQAPNETVFCTYYKQSVLIINTTTAVIGRVVFLKTSEETVRQRMYEIVQQLRCGYSFGDRTPSGYTIHWSYNKTGNTGSGEAKYECFLLNDKHVNLSNYQIITGMCHDYMVLDCMGKKHPLTIHHIDPQANADPNRVSRLDSKPIDRSENLRILPEKEHSKAHTEKVVDSQTTKKYKNNQEYREKCDRQAKINWSKLTGWRKGDSQGDF